MKSKPTSTTSIFELGARATLIRNNKKQSKLCNYADNYYGDQQCLELAKTASSVVKNK